MNGSPIREKHVAFGREYCAGPSLPRHLHPSGYIAVILKGGYLEAGDNGRLRVSEGHVIIHEAFEAHLNSFGSKGAEVLNLPLPEIDLQSSVLAHPDPDRLARLAERDPVEA